MSLSSSQAVYPPAPGDDIDPELLRNTQAYLTCRSQHLPLTQEMIAAWECFYRRYDPLLRWFAVACRVPRVSLDDCVQQVWTELIDKLRSFHYDPQRGRFRSWLYTLVHSKATDLLRRRARHATFHLPPEVADLLRGREEDPATGYERNGKREAVRRALGELRECVSERSYRVLHLRWIEGRTVAEVAAALGLTPAQVRLREHRMKRKIHRLLDFPPRTGPERLLA